MGGMAVGAGFAFDLVLKKFSRRISSSSSGASGISPPQSSTQIRIPAPSSGSMSTANPCPDPSRSTCSFFRAAMRSSARGEWLGGSSTICSHPTGGDPGGEIRKFFSSLGGRSRSGLSSCSRGVGSARKTRNSVAGLSMV